MRLLSLSVLPLWLGCLLVPLQAAEPSEDEKTLKQAKIAIDDEPLLKFFRTRVLSKEDHGRAENLIPRLGDDSFGIREQASSDLVALGPGVAPVLQQAITHPDPEIANRAQECLEIVEQHSTVAILSAAARVLGQRKPAGTARVLIDFAPQADDEEVIEAVRGALKNVAVRDDKPNPVLLQTLQDGKAIRKALAAEALVRGKAVDVPEAQKYLKDPDPFLRLRVALALVEREDRDAVPVLIDLLPLVKLEQAWLAEEILCRLAGEQTPQVSLRQDVPSRETARNAWKKWWEVNAAKVDLAKLKNTPPHLGYTLVCYNDNRGIGKIVEFGKDKKVRWEMAGLMYPVDMQVLSPNRILVAEINAQRVTERNRKGEILWQTQVPQPISCQRLANGNTLIGTRNQLLEVDARGKQTIVYTRARADMMGAERTSKGDYIVMTRTGIIRVDAKGKEGNTISTGRVYTYSSASVLPNGNVLVPLHNTNQVIEYDGDGKSVWSANVTYPTSVQRLPNGNTLVTSNRTRQIVELDRNGRTVSQIPVDGQPFRAFRR